MGLSLSNFDAKTRKPHERLWFGKVHMAFYHCYLTMTSRCRAPASCNQRWPIDHRNDRTSPRRRGSKLSDWVQRGHHTAPTRHQWSWGANWFQLITSHTALVTRKTTSEAGPQEIHGRKQMVIILLVFGQVRSIIQYSSLIVHPNFMRFNGVLMHNELWVL